MIAPVFMGETNGADLSPDERTLYVSESDTQRIWAYKINGDRLVSPRLLLTFNDTKGGELDGLRVDEFGRIFVARLGSGKVSVIDPDRTILHGIRLNGLNPSNLTFGVSEGKTVFITNSSYRGIEAFESDRPGRKYCWKPARACPPSD